MRDKLAFNSKPALLDPSETRLDGAGDRVNQVERSEFFLLQPVGTKILTSMSSGTAGLKRYFVLMCDNY